MTDAPSVRRDWHTLPVADVMAALDTGPRGITAEEAETRLARHGPNVIESERGPGRLAVLARQFMSPVIYILVIAAVVTLLLEEYIDAGVIAFVLALNAGLGYFQERRAEESVRALMKLVSPRAHVIRSGREWEIESSALVPGDVVLLESGVRVPADLRVESTNALRVDESLLTGESVTVTKQAEPMDDLSLPLADRKNIAYAGSIVTSGRGRAIVVGTAMDTELGRIAGHMRTEANPETPMQRRMAHFATIIGVVVAIAAAASFVLGVSLGGDASEMFIVAVALAVAAVPEGLPIAFTITLALGVRRMARRNAIVRRLPAVETLGSTTVIGSDKTGTLTQNRMTVRDMWAGGRLYRIRDDGIEPINGEPDPSPLEEHRPLYLSLLAGVLTNEADIYRSGGSVETQGDPTEAALLLAAEALGLGPAEARQAYEVVAELPFESERQFSSSLRTRYGKQQLFLKGAPERVLSMCTVILSENGEEPLDREAVAAAAAEMAGRGLRVLAFAYRDSGEASAMEHPDGLTFLGLTGLLDPPRHGVLEAIDGCKRAGIRVMMITGDHAATALAIATELGIAREGDEVLAGSAIEDMDAAALEAALDTVVVIARAAPEHKLRVVQALRNRGDVVAITGDGVNDAPALRAADIGVAMGKDGTDVAREAADMVLADDNFVSIYAAVEEGRITFENVRKVTFFLVSTGVASIVAILSAVVLQWPLPMVAAQLLWLNLVTNGLQDVALAFEPGEKGMLAQKPRPKNEGLLSRLLWERTVIAGVIMGIGTLVVFNWELDRTDSLAAAQTAALTTMVLFQVFHVGNSRSTHLSVFQKSPRSNPFLLVATVASVGVHVAALYLPPTQYILRVEPVDLKVWVLMTAVAASVIVVVELHKLLRRERRREGDGLAIAPAGS